MSSENISDLETNTTLPFYVLVLLGVIDSLLILIMLCGNILTICAVKLSRKLSAVLSNQFIFSLALSDIMVALSLPYHYAFFIKEILSTTRELCLLRIVLTILACSSSIGNLIGIAMDRYIAIIYPLHYSRYMTRKVAIVIIISGWIASLNISTIPIFWNRWNQEDKCVSINKVLTPGYINFILIPMFATIWIGMFLVYMRIWREATGHAKRLRNSTNCQYGKMWNDSKSVQVVLLILGCFSLCWLPFYIVILIVKVESRLIYEITLRMAIANSGFNPIIYAWKNSNFRKIFFCLLRCKMPVGLYYNTSFITNYVPPKKINHESTFDKVCYAKQSDISVNCNVNIGNHDKCSVQTDSTGD